MISIYRVRSALQLWAWVQVIRHQRQIVIWRMISLVSWRLLVFVILSCVAQGVGSVVFDPTVGLGKEGIVFDQDPG
jgi:hypothetical protein